MKYRRASNRVKAEVRKAFRDFKKMIASEAKTNPKAFYKYARSKMRTRTEVSDLKRPDSTTADTDVEKAEVLKVFNCKRLHRGGLHRGGLHRGKPTYLSMRCSTNYCQHNKRRCGKYTKEFKYCKASRP